MKAPKLNHRQEVSVVFIVSLVAFAAVAIFLARPRPAAAVIDSYAKCAEAGYPIQESDPPACRANGKTFVGDRLAVTATPLPQDNLPFELLVQGDSGGDYPDRQEVITSQAEWTTYWAVVHADVRPVPPILPIDFETHNVVAASFGQKGTGGYGVKVSNITQSAVGSTIELTESSPGPKCILTQSITNPYVIVSTETLKQPVNFG